MLTPQQREKIVSILGAAADLTLATNRPDGYPQATTVSFVNDGLTLYFGTWDKSQKAQNLARDDRVSGTVDLAHKHWGEVQGISFGGRARRVEEAAEQAKVSALMLRKFPQLGEMLAQVSSEMALFRIDPAVISVLDYTQGFGHAELLTV